MLQGTERSMQPVYQLLNLPEYATAEQVGESLGHLDRIWHFASVPNWSGMGITITAIESDNLIIYSAIRYAHTILNNSGFRASYLRGETEKVDSLENLVEYKHQVEQQYYVFLGAQSKATANFQLFDLLRLPDELLVLIFKKLDNENLLRLARFSSTSGIAREILWYRLIETHDKFKLFRYFSRILRFSPRTLGVTFSLECNEARAKVRLLPYRNMRPPVNLENKMYKIAEMTKENFGTTTAYYAYLQSNAQALFDVLAIPAPHDLEDKKEKTVRQVITSKMSVFQMLTMTLPYTEIVFKNLKFIVENKTKLPSPFKTRTDFETVADYFEYLVLNVHDLFIALHENPGLINQQDEVGRTLLFYPVIAARFLSKRCIQWIIDILTSTPNLNLDIKDKNGDTCVHWTTKNCAHDFHNTESISGTETHVIFDNVFMPLMKLANENGFNFNDLNRAGMSVLHIAANLPKEKPNAVSALLDCLAKEPKTKFDSDLLSGGKHIALYYAVNQLHFNAIKKLLRITDLKGSSTQEVVLLLQEMIFDKCRSLKDKLSTAYHLNHKERLEFFSKLEIELKEVRALHNIFVKIIAHLRPLSDLPIPVISSWLNEDMLKKILERRRNVGWYSSLTQSRESKEAIDRVQMKLNSIEYYAIGAKSDVLWKFIHDLNSEKTYFLNVIIEVFKEELDRLVEDIHALPFLDKALQSLLPVDAKNDNEKLLTLTDTIKRLLSVKLLNLKKTPSEAVTKELGEYFIAITKDVPIEICNALFEFLLDHRDDHVIKASSLWQESVKRHINWPNLIGIIRSNTIQIVRELNELIGDDRAIEKLMEWRKLPIFNLPNSTFENIRGRARAVDELDQLRAQRQKQKELQSKIGSPKKF